MNGCAPIDILATYHGKKCCATASPNFRPKMLIVSEDPGSLGDGRYLPVTVTYQKALHRIEMCTVSKTLPTTSGVRSGTNDALEQARAINS